MVVITAVFNRQKRFDDPGGNGGERHRTSLLPLCDHGAQHGRIECQTFAGFGIDVEPLDAVRWLRRAPATNGRWLLKHDTYGPSVELRATWHDGDRIVAQRKLTRFVGLRALCVPEIVQPIDQLRFGERLPATKLERPSEHAGEHALAFAVKSVVDGAREDHVVVTKDEAQQYGRHGDDACRDADPPDAPDRGDPQSESNTAPLR